MKPILNWLAVSLFLFTSFTPSMAERVEEAVRKPGFVELRADRPNPGADVDWEPLSPVTLPYREYDLADGKNICLLYLYIPGTYTVRSECVWGEIIDGAVKIHREKIRYVITIQGDNPNPPGPTPPGPNPPNPNPTPTPDLTGMALDCWKQAKAVNYPKGEAVRAADAFAGVASAIAAGAFDQENGELAKVSAAKKMFKEALPLPKELQGQIGPFWTWVEKKLNIRARNLTATKEAFRELEKGLRAI